jgi:type IV pilus assembly protein PilQ
LKAVSAADPASTNELVLHIDGEYTYHTTRATGDTVLVDLKGVKVAGVAKDGKLAGGVVTGYHLLQYLDSSGQPVVRVQLNLKQPETLHTRREATGLRLILGPAAEALPTTSPDLAAQAPKTPRTTAGTEPAAGRPAVVSGVQIASGPDGETYVDISTTVPTRYNVLRLQNPPRLVVDLEGAKNATPQKAYPSQLPFVKGVRVGQFRDANPAVVRVVADLAGDPVFDVHAQASGVRMKLKSKSAAKNVASSVSTVATPTVAPQTEAKPVEKIAVPQPAEILSAEAQLPAQPPAKEPEATAEKPVANTIDIQTTLPAAASSPEVAAAPKPEPPAPAPEAIQAARAALTMASAPGTLAAAPQEQPAAAAQEAPKYTGEPISLNLKDVDLKDFFRLIHEISGLNIIVDPNVTGNVTLVLDAVPWDQALDIVLKNNRLGKTLEGNVLRIARVETLTAEQEAASKLAAAREEAQPLVTVFRPVNYAKASTIATMLKSWAGGGALSRRGNILVDERTNTLIISDIQGQIPVIESIITKLDKKAKQISIEARIVLATAAFSRSLGVSLSALTLNKPGSVMTGGATGIGAQTSVTPPVVVTTTPEGETATQAITRTLTAPVVSPSQALAGGFGTYAVSYAQARYIINAAIAAAETRSEAKTISRPSIITQNNVPGTVQQGSQIPIQTTINNTISIQYVSAALTLKVTPQVTEDGNIFLDINVTNSSPGAVLTSAGPSINTQSASTQVLVPDGGTVVFGGVTVTSRSKSASYVPLLGSIPLLGNLFKTRNVQDSDNELLFFVSPKILPG